MSQGGMKKKGKGRKNRTRKTKTPVYDFGRDPSGPSPWVVTPVGFPFPPRHRLHMRYCDSKVLVSTLGAIGPTSFYTNGLYDPQVAVGGHQPMGFDQAMAYYSLALVLQSRIRADFSWNAAAGVGLAPVACGIDCHVSGTPSPYTVWTSYLEAGYPTKVLAVDAIRPVRVGMAFNHEKFFQEDPRGSLAETGNFVTGNPGRLAVFKLWVQSLDQATTSGNVTVNFQIDYDVELSAQNQLPAS